MISTVIAFTGPIGSGKSTLSKIVSVRMGWPLASFGTYLRKTAQSYGFDNSREGLQKAGNYLIGRGWKSFCEVVLADANWKPGSNLIIEGIRHLEAFETLREIVTPSNIYLVYITLGELERKSRLKTRNKNDNNNLQELDHHPTEEQVKTTLFDRSDIVVDNNRPIDKVTAEIIQWIKSLHKIHPLI